KLLASSGFDRKIRLWNTHATEVHSWNAVENPVIPEAPQYIRRLLFMSGGTHLLSLGSEGIVRQCETATGKALRRFSNGPESEFVGMTLSANEKQLITTTYTGMQVWDTATGQNIQTLPELRVPVS